MSARGPRWLCNATLAVSAAWLMVSLSFPFGWDQGILASVGDVVLHGGMPYRDAWDMKGPVAFLWFALAQVLFGRGQIGIRVLELSLLVWSAIVLGAAGARLMRPAAARWTAAALVLCFASLTYFHTAQPDGALSMALAVTLAPMLGQPASRRRIALASLVAGLGTMLKPVYLVFFCVPLLAAVLDGEEPVSRRARTVALAGAAWALPCVIILGWFVARGALGSLIEVHVRYIALNYALGHIDLRYQVDRLAAFWWTGARAVALPFLALGAAALWRRERRAALLLVSWFMLALFAVVVQGKYFEYHWSVIFPPSVLLAAAGLDALIRLRDESRASGSLQVLAYAAVVAVLLPLYGQPLLDIKNWLRYATHRDTPARYYARFGHERDRFSAADEMAAAAYIRAHTGPDDRVALLGYDAPVVYLSGRRNATRFPFSLPLVNWDASRASRSEYRQEFMRSLQTRPSYVIVGLLFEGKTQTVSNFPEFAQYLSEGFQPETSFGEVSLYRRTEASVPGH